MQFSFSKLLRFQQRQLSNASTKIPFEYADFANFFLSNWIMELFGIISVNKYTIEPINRFIYQV